MNKHLRIAVSFALTVITAACNQDETGLQLPKPPITVTKASDTVKIGESLRLHPAVVTLSPTTYQWKLNNVYAGADSVYTFEAKEAGIYRVTFIATNLGGSDSAVYHIRVQGKYENGFYILNEGWFGTEPGSVFYYEYGEDTVHSWINRKENPGKELGGPGNTVQYGAIWKNKLYVVVKAGGPLVVMDALTLKETGRVDRIANGNGMTFLGLTETTGFLSAGDGVYPINLGTLALGTKIAGISNTTGNMLRAGNNVFVHNATGGAIVIDIANNNAVKVLSKATIGFVQAKNEDIYFARDSFLMSANPVTLKLDSVKMKFAAAVPWGAWRSVSMAASTADNNIFIIEPGRNWQYGTKLYRYQAGNAASLSAPFITLPTGQYFYGAGVAYDRHTDELVITTINGPYTGSINRLLFYNAVTGELKKTVTYNGWYFPAMVIPQP